MVQSVATTLAIAAAAVWFVLQGEARPRANITHAITHRALDDHWTWVVVRVDVGNTGRRRLSLRTARVWLQQVLPLTPDMRSALGTPDVIPAHASHVPWHSVGKVYADVPVDAVIEPGETHTLDFEFLIPSDVRTVLVYSYFDNPTYGTNAVGWGHETIYDLVPASGGANAKDAAVDTGAGSGAAPAAR